MSLTQPKRSARISPDRPSIGIIAIILVFVVMLASMTYSFTALRDAARWSDAPEWALFLAPVFIDGSILAYTLALSIFRWRGEPAEARSALRLLRAFTMFSAIVNGMHAASFWEWDYTRYEMWGGITIAALAPVAALFSAEQIIRLVFKRDPNDEATDLAAEPTEPLALPAQPVEPPVQELLESPTETEPVPEVEPELDLASAFEFELPVATQPSVMLPVNSEGLYELPLMR